MEVIRGSIYVEVESIFGIFAAAPVTSGSGEEAKEGNSAALKTHTPHRHDDNNTNDDDDDEHHYPRRSHNRSAPQGHGHRDPQPHDDTIAQELRVGGDEDSGRVLIRCHGDDCAQRRSSVCGSTPQNLSRTHNNNNNDNDEERSENADDHRQCYDESGEEGRSFTSSSGGSQLAGPQLSSHSPFGLTAAARSAFGFHSTAGEGPHGSESTPHERRGRQAEKGFTHTAQPSDSSSPGISTSSYPAVPTLDAARPPSLLLQWGSEAHVVDMQLPLAARHAASTHSCSGGSHSRSEAAPAHATTPPRVTTTSGHSPSPPPNTAAVWEAGMDIAEEREESEETVAVKKTEEGAMRGSSNSNSSRSYSTHTGGPTPRRPHSETTLRSFQCESPPFSTTECDEQQAGTNVASPTPTTATARSTTLTNAKEGVARPLDAFAVCAASPSPGSPLSRTLPASPSPRHRSSRVVVLASPPTAPSSPPAAASASRRRVTLAALVGDLRDDTHTIESIMCVRQAAQRRRGGSGGDAIVSARQAAAAVFAAAWHDHLFTTPAAAADLSGTPNVLADSAAQLRAARRALRPFVSRLTTAVFPVHQRFSFMNVAVEVRSAVAFDLQDAMRQAKLKTLQRGSKEESEEAARANAGCLLLSVASPAELKAARQGSLHSSSLPRAKKPSAVGRLFDRVRDSFRSSKEKEKPPRAGHHHKSTEKDSDGHHHSSDGSARRLSAESQPRDGSLHLSNDTSAPPASLPAHKGSDHLSSSSPPPSSLFSHRLSGQRGEAAAQEDAFTVRLHVSRLLSPDIRAWMKGRHGGLQPLPSTSSSAVGTAAVAVLSQLDSESRHDPSKPSALSRASRQTASAPAAAAAHSISRSDTDQPAVFRKSVCLPLPAPLNLGEANGCIVMMAKVNVVFMPGFDSAEPYKQ